MRPSQVPERVKWAVELLAVSPSDTILEVGCGNGLAVALVAGQLVSGTVTAFDRSPTMVARAQALNRKAIAAGRARVLHMDLLDAAAEERRYRKVFAVNVNAFWTSPASSLAALAQLVDPSGMAYFVYEPPGEVQLVRLRSRLPAELTASGFEVTQTDVYTESRSPMIAFIARLRSPPASGHQG